jgi:hypothetical protein
MHLVANHEELAKKMKLALRSIFVNILNGYLTCRKILRHGVHSFNFPQKEGMLLIFIALNNPWPLPGLNP